MEDKPETNTRSDIADTEPQVMPAESRQRLDRGFPMFGPGGLAAFGQHRYLATSDAKPFLQQYYNTPVNEGDIWVMSLPKCGTTWMQELVWLVSNGCDFKSAECLLCPDRYHFLELAAITVPSIRREIENGRNETSKRQFQPITNRKKPWFVKTHLPLYLCPPTLLQTAKVVYVARNPKDMCVSYFSHLKLFEERDPNMSFDQFVDLFTRGEVMGLPYFPHVLEAWKNRHNKNLLVIFFEEMKNDLRSCIKRVGSFLGKSLSNEQLDALMHHLSFDTMKNNQWINKSALYAYSPLLPEEIEASSSFLRTSDQCHSAVGENATVFAGDMKSNECHFMRKGRVGDWINHFSGENSKKFDRWMSDNLVNSDLKFIMTE